MRLQREVWSQGVRDCLHCIAGRMARLPASHGDDNAHHTMVDEYEVKLQWLNVTAGTPCCSAKTGQHLQLRLLQAAAFLAHVTRGEAPNT